MSGEGIELDREPVWLSHFKELLDARFLSVDQRFEYTDKALELQAGELARRLDELNHAHARAQEALNTFVRIDKWEDKVESEENARKIALNRLDERIKAVDTSFDEKLNAYITKTEARQADIETAIATSKHAAEEAKRVAEKEGRDSRDAAEAQHRKTNRNMAIAGLLLTGIIALSNWFGSANPPNPAPPTTTIPSVTTVVSP